MDPFVWIVICGGLLTSRATVRLLLIGLVVALLAARAMLIAATE